MIIDDQDRQLIAALEGGLPLCKDPYGEIAKRAFMKPEEVLSRLSAMRERGIINRHGLVVHHHRLGYRSNAMVVWDIPDESLATLGHAMAAFPFVTLCYRRPRRLPVWPYNLFCMIHGKSRAQVEEQVLIIVEKLGLKDTPRDVLFSRRRFKQCGAHYVSKALPDSKHPPILEKQAV